MNRLTITLDDDLYAMARSHAIARKTSLSKAIADLMRQSRSDPGDPSAPPTGVHPLSGFPVSRGDGRTMTNADVLQAIDDDLDRPMEIMGLAPEAIEEARK